MEAVATATASLTSGAVFPGDGEPVAAAVQRARLGLDVAGADHGDLDVRIGRDDAAGRGSGHGCPGQRPGVEVSQRVDAGRAARRLRDPFGARVDAVRAGLRRREAVGRAGGVGDPERVAGAAPGNAGGDVVTGCHTLPDYLDRIGGIHLPAGEVVGRAEVALDQRAVLLDRAAAVAIDPDPEGRERGGEAAAGTGRLGPASAGAAERLAGVGVAGPVGASRLAEVRAHSGRVVGRVLRS